MENTTTFNTTQFPFYNNSTPTNSSNITRPRFRGPFTNGGIATGDIIAAVFYSILVILIVCGNSLVIGSFRINRRLRTTTNYFIMSLAIADLAIGTICIPLWVYFTMYPPALRRTEYTFWLTFDVIVGVSSILNLTMISLERCYALVRPIQHRSISKTVVVIAIVMAWILASFAGSLRLMLPPIYRKNYGIILTIPFFVVPLTIILGTYGVIFKIASAHARGRGVRSFRKDLRIATTIAVVIGLFSISWLPFFTLNIFFAICIDFGAEVCYAVPPDLSHVVKWMQYGNSACNPIIYGFRNKDFRSAFKKIILSMCGKEVQMTSYSRSTYVATARKRFVRSESSFDDSQSVLYPDQIVPPGMYDMRVSYRKAIHSGRKRPVKKKKPGTGVAQGLMTLNMQTFSMPETGCNESTSTTNVLDSSNTLDTNGNAAGSKNGISQVAKEQKSAPASSDIDIYPLENEQEPHDIGTISELFVHGNESSSSSSPKRPHSRVHFSEEQGVDNKGLEKEIEEKTSANLPPERLEVDVERERCYSDVMSTVDPDLEETV